MATNKPRWDRADRRHYFAMPLCGGAAALAAALALLSLPGHKQTSRYDPTTSPLSALPAPLARVQIPKETPPWKSAPSDTPPPAGFVPAWKIKPPPPRPYVPPRPIVPLNPIAHRPPMKNPGGVNGARPERTVH
jgi:hypothetical protein